MLVFAKPGRSSRQMEKRRALLLNAANELTTTNFKNTQGIQVAPVVDRKNPRVCIADRLSGFTMPPSNIVMNRGACVGKVHEKAALPGVFTEELVEFPAKSLVPQRETWSFNLRIAFVRVASSLFFLWLACATVSLSPWFGASFASSSEDFLICGSFFPG